MTIVRTLRIERKDLPFPFGSGWLSEPGDRLSVLFQAEQDAAIFDARTFAVLQLGEARIAERYAWAVLQEHETNANIVAWDDAVKEVVHRERLALAADLHWRKL